MGYSYAAAAGYTLDAIGKLINVECSNGMPDGGFYEHGREQADGAITGTVYAPMPDGKHCGIMAHRGKSRPVQGGRSSLRPA